MDKQKLNTTILILILLVSVFNIFIPGAGGDISVTVYPDTVFPIGHFNFSVNPARNFRYIEIGTFYIRFNHINISCWSTNGVNVSINNIASSLTENEQFKFTATATTGTAWFNISGLNPFVTYTVNRDSSSNIVCVSNASGGISFSESSWSSHTYTGSSGAVGSNLRSDGSYLFMTMEDGIQPTITTTSGATTTIDSNNSIEGKYSLNYSYNGLAETKFLKYRYDSNIRPDSWSIKILLKDDSTNDLNVHVNDSLSGQLFSVDFYNDTGVRTIRLNGDASKTFFSGTPYELNTIYTITASNINYASDTFTVTVSNATASSSRTDSFSSGDCINIYEFVVASYIDTSFCVLFDDWTVGTQSNISTTALWPWSYPVSSSVINETRATITGTINNDGSPLQNNSEFNNTVSVLYDTVPHNTTTYSYYFNESSSTEQWGTNSYYMNDTNENTYATTVANGGINVNGTLVLRPNNIGDVSLLVPTGDILGWQCVDEETKDDDATYVIDTGSGSWGDYALYNFKDITVLGVVINYIKLIMWGKETGNADPNVVMRIKTGGTEYLSSCISFPDKDVVYTERDYTWNINPKTLSTWTWNDINNLQAGIELISAWGNMRCTQFYIEVNYTVPTQLLVSHSGNNSALNQNGNISKIEVRAKSNLSSGSYDGIISLQPVWNNTNGTQYNVFSTSSASWSDWIDITQDVNYSHPDWNDSRELRCRVIANLSSGIAFVGMVELRISINRTLDYAFNASNIGTYHTGDTTSIPISGLTPGQVYFYRTKINTSYINSSSYYYGDEHYFLTKPYNCTAPVATKITELEVNLSWTKGQGANTTVLREKQTPWVIPASATDGNEIYNGTGNYYHHTLVYNQPSFIRAWSYDNWTVNPTLWHYSDNYTEFNWSIIGFNVFNQSNMAQPISPFTLEIATPDASFSYYATGCTNTHYIHITNITIGIVYIWIDADGYKKMPYTETINQNTIYNKSYYLPPDTTESDTPTPPEDCTLRSSIDSISISSYTSDATITLQHNLEEIISVELYNDSLYGTYGGWLFIASSNYTTSTNSVIINKSVLDINTTMARVQYYYMYCPGQTIETPLYYLRVVETIETEYTEVDRGVEDALLKVKRLNNITGQYEVVASIFTDANGYVNVYLLPSVTYNINITKYGYNSESSWYTPAPPNQFGQTIEKIFRIILIDTNFSNVTIPPGFYDHIIFNGTMFTNGSIFVNYVDLSSETINAQFYTYMNYNYSRLLIDTQNIVLLNSFQYWITGINASRQHMVTIFLNHTTLGAVSTSIFLGPVNNSLYHDPAIVEDAAKDVYGNFDLGYVRFFIEWLPFIGILVVLGRIEAGMGIFGGALYLALVGEFFNDLPAELWQVIPIILLFAVLWYIVTKGKFRL